MHVGPQDGTGYVAYSDLVPPLGTREGRGCVTSTSMPLPLTLTLTPTLTLTLTLDFDRATDSLLDHSSERMWFLWKAMVALVWPELTGDQVP